MSEDEGAAEDQGVDLGDATVAPDETTGDAGLAPSAQVPGRQPVLRAQQRTADPVLRILPLGSGLVLIGLGLALALLALRLRHDPRLLRPWVGGR